RCSSPRSRSHGGGRSRDRWEGPRIQRYRAGRTARGPGLRWRKTADCRHRSWPCLSLTLSRLLVTNGRATGRREPLTRRQDDPSNLTPDRQAFRLERSAFPGTVKNERTEDDQEAVYPFFRGRGG